VNELLDLASKVIPLATLVGVIISWTSLKRDAKRKAEEETIKRVTTDIKLDNVVAELKALKDVYTLTQNDIRALLERMVKVEQSTSSAHRRIDEMINN
jgi:site-specific recombinase XerD